MSHIQFNRDGRIELAILLNATHEIKNHFENRMILFYFFDIVYGMNSFEKQLPERKKQKIETLDQKSSPSEKSSDLLDEKIKFNKQRIAKITESINDTNLNLITIRDGLGLSPTAEEPSSVTSTKDTLKKLSAEIMGLEKQKEDVLQTRLKQMETENPSSDNSLSISGKSIKRKRWFGKKRSVECVEQNSRKYVENLNDTSSNNPHLVRYLARREKWKKSAPSSYSLKKRIERILEEFERSDNSLKDDNNPEMMKFSDTVIVGKRDLNREDYNKDHSHKILR
jgi:hypothetical protein